jgi:hypothetical protein
MCAVCPIRRNSRIPKQVKVRLYIGRQHRYLELLYASHSRCGNSGTSVSDLAHMLGNSTRYLVKPVPTVTVAPWNDKVAVELEANGFVSRLTVWVPRDNWEIDARSCPEGDPVDTVPSKFTSYCIPQVTFPKSWTEWPLNRGC